MRKFLSGLLKNMAEVIENKRLKSSDLEKTKTLPQKSRKQPDKKTITRIISSSERAIRDFAEMMENPFLSLSKKRKNPIIYESPDGTRKVKVTRHTGHFLASIYDWDIILFVSGRIQEILNSGSDIPPRTLVFPRHEILKALHKHDGKKQQKDLENSLQRLKRTAIDTTIRNEDYRYKADFGFIDSWEYTERKERKEIKITLSQWIYDGICTQGALLKVDQAYFDITSALKRFLYRTARKHVGKNKESWEFSIEKLYEKSGSESELKVFKNKIKKAVSENDIPGYSIKWIEKNGKAFVSFRDKQMKKIDELIEKLDENEQNFIEFKRINEVIN